MKRSLKNQILPWMAPVLGLLGMASIWAVFAFGSDEKNLILPFHISILAVWLLTAAMAGGMVFLLWDLTETRGFRRLFPDSRLAALGTLVAGLCILATVIESLTAMNEPIRILSGILKIAAGIALLHLAWCRWNNLRGSFLAWAAVTAYMLLRIMFEYRSWSIEPQLLRYLFPLLASVSIALAMYHRTAFALRMGSRKQFLFFSQFGAFCCLLALPAEPVPFYLGMAIWALTDRCSLKAVKQKNTDTPEDKP